MVFFPLITLQLSDMNPSTFIHGIPLFDNVLSKELNKFSPVPIFTMCMSINLVTVSPKSLSYILAR